MNKYIVKFYLKNRRKVLCQIEMSTIEGLVENVSYFEQPFIDLQNIIIDKRSISYIVIQEKEIKEKNKCTKKKKN